MSNSVDPHDDVGLFFDTLSSDYTTVIERCFPRYREMLWAVLDYLPTDLQPKSILELGCGTGNLSALLAAKYPDAQITLVDVSADSLEQCRHRLCAEPSERFVFDEVDFRELKYAADTFDLVASSIAVHHLVSKEKQSLFSSIYRCLRPGGVFSYADQHAGVTDDLSRRHHENWYSMSMNAGSSDSEWEMWMQHQREHDHHDTLGDQMRWLGDAGFPIVDCPWRYLLWTVLQARK